MAYGDCQSPEPNVFTYFLSICAVLSFKLSDHSTTVFIRVVNAVIQSIWLRIYPEEGKY